MTLLHLEKLGRAEDIDESQLGEVDDRFLILDWATLPPENIAERIEWLRNNLAAGDEWGYCEELQTCLLKTKEAVFHYKIRWYGTVESKLIKMPSLLTQELVNHVKDVDKNPSMMQNDS